MKLRDLSPHFRAQKAAKRAAEFYQLAKDLGVPKYRADQITTECVQNTLPFLRPTQAEWDRAKARLIDWATRPERAIRPRTFGLTVEDLSLPAQVDPHPDLTQYKERE